MTDEKQENLESAQSKENAVSQDTSPQTEAAKTKPLNLRETILAAKAEAEAKADREPEKTDKAEKPEKSGAKAEPEPPAREAKEPEKRTDAKEADKPNKEEVESKESDRKKDDEEKKQLLKPPASWSKSNHAEWEGLSESAQRLILKREEDTARGVEELKKRHGEELNSWKTRLNDVEEAIRPYEEIIQNSGRTKGQVVKDLLDWNMALAGPNRLDAFRALARTFGVDTTQLSGVTVAQGATDASAATDNQQTPAQYQMAPDRSWEPAIRSVAQRLEQFEQTTAAQRQATAEQVVNNWARDKTHFEKVRVLMAQLVDQDAKMGGPRFLKNGQIDMDAAYETAIWADPEVRDLLLQEQRDKHEAVVKAAAEKAKADADARILAEKQRADAERAKRAAVSLRPSAPISGVNGAGPGAIPSRESVRESIKRALSGM